MQIRRSAKTERSGFLHTLNSRKTDGIVSNQWRIGIIDILEKTLHEKEKEKI